MSWQTIFGEYAETVPEVKRAIAYGWMNANFYPLSEPDAAGVARFSVQEPVSSDYAGDGSLPLEPGPAGFTVMDPARYGLAPSDNGYSLVIAFKGHLDPIAIGDPENMGAIAGYVRDERIGVVELDLANSFIVENPAPQSAWKSMFQPFLGVVGTFAAMIASGGAAAAYADAAAVAPALVDATLPGELGLAADAGIVPADVAAQLPNVVTSAQQPGILDQLTALTGNVSKGAALFATLYSKVAGKGFVKTGAVRPAVPPAQSGPVDTGGLGLEVSPIVKSVAVPAALVLAAFVASR